MRHQPTSVPPGTSRLLELIAEFRNTLAHLPVSGAEAQPVSELRRLLDAIEGNVARLDPRGTTGTAGIRDLAGLRQTIMDTRERLKELQTRWEEVNRSLSQELVDAAIGEKGRSLRRWIRRWGEDATAAEASYRALREMLEGDADLWSSSLDDVLTRLGLRLTREDLWIAELYYYGGFTQKQIADLIGISQPTVGARLPRVDGRVCQELLKRRVVEAASGEGWESSLSYFEDFGPMSLSFDIWLEKGDTQIGLDVHVLLDKPKRDVWSPYFQSEVSEMSEKSALASAYEPNLVLGLAVYNMADRFKGVYLLPELESVLSRAQRASGSDRVEFRQIKGLLQASLSPNSALERARAPQPATFQTRPQDGL